MPTIASRPLWSPVTTTAHPASVADKGRKLRNGRRGDAGEVIFYLHNIGGSSSAAQIANFRASLADSPHTIVILIETWFNRDIKSSEIFDEKDWVVLRCDRCDIGDNRRGGGALIAIRRRLVASHVSVDNSQNVEQVCAKIQLPEKNIFIGAAYIPPNADPLAYEQLVTVSHW